MRIHGQTSKIYAFPCPFTHIASGRGECCTLARWSNTHSSSKTWLRNTLLNHSWRDCPHNPTIQWPARERAPGSVCSGVYVRVCVFCVCMISPLWLHFPLTRLSSAVPSCVCVCLCVSVLGFVRLEPPKACEECFQPSTWKRWWNETNNQAHEKERRVTHILHEKRTNYLLSLCLLSFLFFSLSG